MLSSVSVAWSDILSSIRRSHWLTGAAGNGAMCNKLKMIALLKSGWSWFGGTMEKRSPFWHFCNLFLMYSNYEWQPNYTHCKFGACFHRWTEFAFSWRTGKQRPRVVHAVTITCLHCKYSFELQRRQAEDPRVVHAMTLAPADFSWRTDREGAHSLGPIWQQPSCTASSFWSWRGDNWRRPRGIHEVTSTYIHSWRLLSLKNSQTELTGHTCSATATCGQQHACTASIFWVAEETSVRATVRTSTGRTCNDCNLSCREESGRATGHTCDDTDIHYWSFLSVEELTKGAQGLDRIRSDSNPHPLNPRQILCGIGSRQHAMTLALT